MESASPCMLCNEKTHMSRKCPELWKMPTPKGGGGGHGDDEDYKMYENFYFMYLDFMKAATARILY